jgi:flagellar hook-associated protein 1 FlgK
VNQSVLTAQVDASRESLSGINIDEEMVNLLAAQRGYEGASRVLTTMDSMLDTLINRTGLVR